MTQDEQQTPEPERPEPDDKDWTFAATQRCAECGYVPVSVADVQLADALRATVPRWRIVLTRLDARQRPAPQVWSPLEYACHIRDVHGVFSGRITQMRTEDSPHFDSWDGDAAAIENGYYMQDPAVVTAELADATERVAAKYDDVPAGDWSRSGIRGGGGTFTISSLGHYQLHDVIHHLHDVRG
ncbi:MAG: DinB family protein [Nakamurella sp.]